ncbi:HAMP domain-containing protein [bacterium]|nr:HAMP domain-containing protein [bacterium]
MKLSVAGKMTIITSVLLAAVFLVTTLINVKLQEEATIDIVRQNALELAETADAVLQASMKVNARDRIQSTIDDFAAHRDVKLIRIYTKGGQIAYSTDHDEIGVTLDLRQDRCLICHRESPPPPNLPPEERARVVEAAGEQTLAVSHVLLNRPTCSTTECHTTEGPNALLGVMDIDLDLEAFHQARERNMAGMGLAGLVGVVLGVIVIYLTGREIVYRRVAHLTAQTRKLAAGDLTVRIDDESADEIGALDRAFNTLALDLKDARSELLEWGRTLEQRVAAKTDELVRAQDQMVQVEKMASLGKLAAVVAHEINNPLASVVTYAKILLRRIDKPEMSEECRKNLGYLESISSEATRCGEIVAQLLTFAHRGSGEITATDLNDVVEKSLFLVNHQFELNAVETVMNLDPAVPPALVDRNKIQQLLMALFINAAQAMREGGRLEVTTRPATAGAEIIVADNGPGMVADVARHAFEPFYTTKEEGGGVGLGLSVVYGIVKGHGGRIDLDTAPGQGCRFTIWLPLKPHAAKEEEEVR